MIEIETAFKKKIKTLFPTFLSIYENVSQPSSISLATPYQELYFLPSYNDDAFVDNSKYLAYGIFQATLKFPVNKGTLEIETMVKTYLTNFKSSQPLLEDGISVNIVGVPTAKKIGVVDTRFVYIISINYFAQYEMV